MKKLICVLLVLTSAVGLSKKNETEVVSEPRAIVSISPAYPKTAYESKTEGWVNVQFTINEQGSVENPIVLSANPPNVFDEQALRAISKFKFVPKIVNKKAVPVVATKKIEFRLP